MFCLILDQKFGRKGQIHQGNGQFEGTFERENQLESS
jgi:hypothetical protein